MKNVTVALQLLLLLAACSKPAPSPSTLTGFRTGLPEVQDLSGGVPSLDSLGKAVSTAMMQNDGARLAELGISRAEFAWIYYPTNPQAKPPYDLDPETMWMMLEGQSGKGMGRAMERLNQMKLTYQKLDCGAKPSLEGENQVYGPCVITLTDDKGAVSQGRIFSQVISRHGQWKVVSYANQLD